MSDRAYLAVTIYACPPEHRQALDDLLDDATMEEGGHYTWEERPLGDDVTFANDLTDISPEIAYRVDQDAYANTDGAAVLYVPGMGTFTADLTASGQIIVTREETLAAIRGAGGDLPETLAAVDALHGQPFVAALEALTAEPPAHPEPASA